MAQAKNINTIPNDAITRVHVSQGDIGRTIYFNLYEGSLAYIPTSGDVITCVGTKPSGLGFTVNCTWSGNVVTCVTTEAMTDESGSIDAELVITSGDESTVLGTSNFVLAVEENPHPSDTTDGTQITAQSLESRIEALEDDSLSITVSNETLIITRGASS